MEEDKGKTWEYLNIITFAIMLLIVGFTFGIKYGNGVESCKGMIKMYGCKLEGQSDYELLKQGINPECMGNVTELNKFGEDIEEINFTIYKDE